MSDPLSKTDHYLLNEYNNAATLTSHLDELRNKLTSFYLTFTIIAVGALAIFIKGEATKINNSEVLISLLLVMVALIGIFEVIILAKLRKVQLENFRIINNIREYFLGNDKDLWNIVQLSSKTLPKPNKHSGTFFWLQIIVLVSTCLLATALYLLMGEITIYIKIVLSIVAFIVAYLFMDAIYLHLAQPPEPIKY